MTQPTLADPNAPVISVPVPPPTQQPATTRTFTEDEVNAIARRERDKLYPDLEELRTQNRDLAARLGTFETEREGILRQQQEAEATRLAAEEAARQADLTLQQRLAETQQQQQAELLALREGIEARDTLLARERAYTDLMDYRANVLSSEVGQAIMPELRDLVAGNTPAEIDASVALYTDRSNAIVAQVTGMQQQARIAMPTTSITSPPIGPSDVQEQYRNYSLQELKEMPLSEYGKVRSQLLGRASQVQQNRGMYA